MNRNNWLCGVTVSPPPRCYGCSGEPNPPAASFILISVSISMQQNPPQTAESRLGVETLTIGCRHISLFGQPLLLDVTAHASQIPKFALFTKNQQALIIRRRTFDNKFAIKMSDWEGAALFGGCRVPAAARLVPQSCRLRLQRGCFFVSAAARKRLTTTH